MSGPKRRRLGDDEEADLGEILADLLFGDSLDDDETVEFELDYDLPGRDVNSSGGDA